jgi:glycosyltransferase involved in cell wall biosynthesis
MFKWLHNVIKKRYEVSIVIPTYKNTKFLEECIDSIIISAKRCDSFEILLGIDNCNETLVFLNSHKIFKNSCIKIFYFSKNVGPYIIRNTLLKKAKYKNILFFDSDDVMMPDSIKKINEALLQNDIVKYKFYNFDHGKNFSGDKNLSKSSIYSHGCFGIKKQLLIDMNGFRPWTCAADAEFSERCAAQSIPVHKIEDPLFYRRYHENNLSKQLRPNSISSTKDKYSNMIYDLRAHDVWPNPEYLFTENYSTIQLFGELNYVISKKNEKPIDTFTIYGLGNDGKLKMNESHVHNDMAVMCCYYNWCGFEHPKNNFYRFLGRMKYDGVPLYGIELSLTDKFETTDMDGFIQIKVNRNNICFQKEAALNLLEKYIPEHFTKIAWIDTDLIFTNKKWYIDTSNALTKYKLVQMYQAGNLTNRYGGIIKNTLGNIHAGGPTKTNEGHPGGAWAANREFWKHGGLYPYCAVGGGDTLFLYSLFENCINDRPVFKNLSGKSHTEYTAWKEKIYAYVNESVTCIKGGFIHEWHGEKEGRNYKFRHKILKKLDIANCIKLNSIGLLQIDNVEESVYKDIFEYFLNRNEDGIL